MPEPPKSKNSPSTPVTKERDPGVSMIIKIRIAQALTILVLWLIFR